jgi:hypothetical protein
VWKSQKRVKVSNEPRYINSHRAKYRKKDALSNELIFITLYQLTHVVEFKNMVGLRNSGRQEINKQGRTARRDDLGFINTFQYFYAPSD